MVVILPNLSVSGVVNGSVQLVESHQSSVTRHHDFSGVVVWLRPAGGPQKRSVPRHALMVQKDKQFSPHILPINTGDFVDFPNLDPIFHNAFSNFDGQLFDIGLYPPGASRSVRFGRTGIVRVFCNIHPAMSAVIAVLDSPYFATTEKNGSYSIAQVPAGEYDLRIIHERATQETLDRLAHAVQVTDPDVSLPTITISESGYLPAPHKNKYGLDYPASHDSGYGLPSQ